AGEAPSQLVARLDEPEGDLIGFGGPGQFSEAAAGRLVAEHREGSLLAVARFGFLGFVLGARGRRFPGEPGGLPPLVAGSDQRAHDILALVREAVAEKVRLPAFPTGPKFERLGRPVRSLPSGLKEEAWDDPPPVPPERHVGTVQAANEEVVAARNQPG